MDTGLIIAIVVATALAFDFTNGFHDTANSMAATIATGALKPRTAVTIAALCDVIGAFISLKVAVTIAKGIVDPSAVTLSIIFGGLVGAIMWNLATWYLGLPSSSSHALIGGVIGATAIVAGWSAVKGEGIVQKVLVPAVISPILAGVVAIVATRITRTLTQRENKREVARGYRLGQIASSSLLSLAHGTNDAQKTMGVITLALIANGDLSKGSDPPLWVIISAALAIGSGTWLGGWRIMHTLGKKVTDFDPSQGFSANCSAATVILAASHAGFPLSTTHVASGSIIGSGIGSGSTVEWSIAGRMVSAWVLTLPGAGIVGAIGAWVAADGIGGTAGVLVVAALAAAGALWFVYLTRKNPISHHHVAPDQEELVDLAAEAAHHHAPKPKKAKKAAV